MLSARKKNLKTARARKNKHTARMHSISLRLGALCLGTEKEVVQTPWCQRNNCVLVRQFSARQFVYCIVGRHEEKMREQNPVQTSVYAKEQCPSTTLEVSARLRAPKKSHVQISVSAV